MARNTNSGWLSTRVAFAAATLIAGGALVASAAMYAPASALADDDQAVAAQTEADEQIQPQSEDDSADQGGHLTVSLVANNGTDDVQYDSTTLVAGAYDVPECPFTHPDGWKFVCWSRTPNGIDGGSYLPGSVFEDFNSDFSLYAQWQPAEEDTITVSFDANGGSGTMDDVNVTIADGYITVPECTFTAPEGRTFLCWSTTPTGEDGVSLKPGETYGNFTSEFTLYAQWQAAEENRITVHFDANGGSGTMDDQETTLVDGYFVAPECAFTAPTEDQEFEGWSLESSDGSTAVLYQPGDKIEAFTEDFTLIATWGAKDDAGEITVHFDADGGVGTMADQHTSLVAGYFVAPECEFKPITDDLEFKGWSLLSSDGATAVLYQPGDKITDFNEDFTLYATWGAKAGNIVVNFDANGGTGTMENQTTTLVAGYFKVPECDFTAPAGKVFKGWSTEKDGSGKLYQPGDMFEDFNDNFTLYAIWGDPAAAATDANKQNNAIAKTGDATDYAPVAAVAGLGAVLAGAAAAAFRKAFKK